ncbi:MAG TPA: T9SS type A sorting domain-containing protein [Chitinispirillaceae bacterium]|nr:T9SS type A sorting domain-containing protein [Chitinispirillaceae bacterium]
MSKFKWKAVLSGFITILTASSMFAQEVTVLDATFDDNANNLEGYWYYYDDSAGVSLNDRPQSDPDSKPSTVDVPFTWEPRNAYDGDPADKKGYEFQTDVSFSKPCATMPFTLSEPWEAQDGGWDMDPFVGIGTGLCRDGESIDLTGVTAIKFKAKMRVNDDVGIKFKVQTKDIEDYTKKKPDEFEYDEFGYWGYDISVSSGDWQQFEIEIDEEGGQLICPSWAADFAFDITNCTKLAWDVLYTEDLTVDTLDIAELELVGVKIYPPSVWTKVETGAPAKGLFSTFEGRYPSETPLRTYWYAYNDAEIGGQSTVSETYAVQNEETKRLTLNFVEASGSDGVGKAAALEYTIGPMVEEVRDGKTVNIQGFVGIGCNLYDSSASEYYDCGDSVTAIYFEYFTYGDEKVTFEISDINDVSDANEPDRGNSRGDGIVHFRTLLGTEGQWTKVMIPLNDLYINSHWEGYNEIPFDINNLAKIQWKVQASEGSEGIFAIDNITLVGGNFGLDESSVKNNMSKAAQSSFKTVYSNGKINISFNNSELSNGKISLINTKGAVVKSLPVSNAKSLSTTLSTDNISNGMYIVRFNAKGLNGKSIVRQSKINIVK